MWTVFAARPSRLARYGFADNGARAADLLGRRRIFVAGLLLFVTALVLALVAVPAAFAQANDNS